MPVKTIEKNESDHSCLMIGLKYTLSEHLKSFQFFLAGRVARLIFEWHVQIIHGKTPDIGCFFDLFHHRFSRTMASLRLYSDNNRIFSLIYFLQPGGEFK